MPENTRPGGGGPGSGHYGGNGLPEIRLLNGNRGTSNVVCGAEWWDPRKDYELDMTKRRRRRRSGYRERPADKCPNDEARSMWLSNVPKGTNIRIYDRSSSRRRLTGDDWTNITAREFI